MEPHVVAAVLIAALMHAGWNAVVKIEADRFLSVALITLAAGVIAILALPFVAVPRSAAWPWLLGSSVLHSCYKLFLIEAYRTGDLGQAYPIARGGAPLVVAVVSGLALDEALGPTGLLGIVLLTVGVCLMSVRGGRELASIEGRAIGFALGTSICIAAYTLVDGVGARVNRSAHGFALWLFALDALLMLVILLAMRGPVALGQTRRFWTSGAGGGAMSLGAYWIVIWAMTKAPIALVAALRESSVLFAALISAVIVREPFTIWRSCAAIIIAGGLVLVRLH